MKSDSMRKYSYLSLEEKIECLGTTEPISLTEAMDMFDSEQPDDYIKSYVESQLDKVGWKVDYVFSHTVPLSYMPREAFLPNINSDLVDNSTEEWLETIGKKLSYEGWYAGHYHINWNMNRVHINLCDFPAL